MVWSQIIWRSAECGDCEGGSGQADEAGEKRECCARSNRLLKGWTEQGS